MAIEATHTEYFNITIYCDLRGQIKGAAHILFHLLKQVYNMINSECSLHALLNAACEYARVRQCALTCYQLSSLAAGSFCQ